MEWLEILVILLLLLNHHTFERLLIGIRCGSQLHQGLSQLGQPCSQFGKSSTCLWNACDQGRPVRLDEVPDSLVQPKVHLRGFPPKQFHIAKLPTGIPKVQCSTNGMNRLGNIATMLAIWNKASGITSGRPPKHPHCGHWDGKESRGRPYTCAAWSGQLDGLGKICRKRSVGLKHHGTNLCTPLWVWQNWLTTDRRFRNPRHFFGELLTGNIPTITN